MSFSEVMREFQRRGIGDEDQITEHIAFLLLVYQHCQANNIELWEQIGNHPDKFRHFLHEITNQMEANRESNFPQAVPLDITWIDGVYHVLNSLKRLLEDYNGLSLGQFFQQQVRYHLLRGSRGERYPTPHHIATFIAQLILPQNKVYHFEDVSLFDPTCGTGGLLVAAHQCQPEIEFVGCDYNTRWARLSYANLYLNNVSNFTVLAQAAQQFQQFNSQIGRPTTATQFDYILMNPPFDSRVVFELIALAVHSLLEDGQAALLVPAGVVQRNDDKAELLPNGLQAVITLPPDSFRPYNGIRSHILLLHKANLDNHIWFCALQADGYGTGMARPLDQPAYPEVSELPRTLRLIQQRQAVWPFVHSLTEGTQLEAVSLSPADNSDKHPGGLALRLTGEEAQPIVWNACHLGSSALVWWAESELLQNEQLLYTDYIDGTPILLTRAKIATITWSDQLSTAANQPTTAEWQIDDSNISLLWETDNLTLKQSGRGSFADLSFTVDGTGNYGACLLNESGTPVSAWYWSTDLPEQVEKAVIDNGQTLYAATGEPTGWLLPFSADENSLTLLLVQHTSPLLFAKDNQVAHYGLLWQARNDDQSESGGVWSIANGTLTTRSGPHLNNDLRTPDSKAVGIAFGPQVGDPSEAILFGVYVTRSALQQQSLEPEQYLPELRQVELQQRPAEILARIRYQQRAMDTHIDALLSAMGQEIAPFIDEPSPLLGLPLNEPQQTLWQRLRGHAETYLSLKQIEEEGCQDELFTAVEVDQQVDLFISLGLLLPVTVEKQNLYRCVRVNDVVEVT